MLRPGGGMYHVVGNMNEYTKLTGMATVMKGRQLTTSNVGGIAETQRMLDFAEEHGILATVNVISADQLEQAMCDMKNRLVRLSLRAGRPHLLIFIFFSEHLLLSHHRTLFICHFPTKNFSPLRAANDGSKHDVVLLHPLYHYHVRLVRLTYYLSLSFLF
jgi:hypothetical protein